MGALLAKVLAIAVIVHGPCPQEPFPGAGGVSCTVPPATVYLAPGDERNRNHELGHLYDFNFLTNAERGTFEYLRGLHREWWDGPNAPAEQFAEAVRSCAHSMRWLPSVTDYDFQPTTRQYSRICRWLTRLR